MSIMMIWRVRYEKMDEVKRAETGDLRQSEILDGPETCLFTNISLVNFELFMYRNKA